MIRTIILDADDTLWHNENFFRENEEAFFELLAPYGSRDEIFKLLFQREMDNLEAYGYGIKAFILSMLETYTAITTKDDPNYYDIISQILKLGREQIDKPVVLLEGVEETLATLSTKYRLIIATKGDPLDQERKLRLSGLSKYFHHMEVMTDKQISDYEGLLKRLDLKAEDTIMIGNSPKSDVQPILTLGGWGIFIPYLTIWEHEKVKEEFDSPRYFALSSIKEVPALIEYIMGNAPDPMGTAIADHFKGNKGTLIVHSPDFEDDTIPCETLFRTFNLMPQVEKEAIEYCVQKCKSNNGKSNIDTSAKTSASTSVRAVDAPKLKILDVGAGSGCHSLALQQLIPEAEVVAIDTSPLSVKTMKSRGVADAHLTDFYDEGFVGTYDLILMLMNGTGIIGNIENIGRFFDKLKTHLAPGGELLIDSSDLIYLYEEEDGSCLIDLNDKYYGEISYQMEYLPESKSKSKHEDKNSPAIIGKHFDWLYIDLETLKYYCQENGFTCELLYQGESYEYLVTVKNKNLH